MSVNPKFHIPLPKEAKGSWTEGCTAGLGFFFECAWFDACLASIIFGLILIISQKYSEKLRIYRRLDEEDQRDWVKLIANFIMGLISAIAAFYILFNDDWYLDHPSIAEKTVDKYNPALSFFLPWTIGYNSGKIILVISHYVRALPEANAWDCLPLILHLAMYIVILDHHIFGMLAVFQMLLESHHIYSSPMALMEYNNKSNTNIYKILNILAYIYRPISMLFAGPYCLSMLWYHWNTLYEFTGFTKWAFSIIIGLNTIFFIGDIGFGIYSLYAIYIGGWDPKKYWNDWAESERQQTRKLKRKGYKKIFQNDNEIDQDSDDDDDNIQLGKVNNK